MDSLLANVQRKIHGQSQGVPDPPPGKDRSLGATVHDRSHALTQSLAFLVKLHGGSVEICEQLRSQLTKYLDSSEDERVWLKRAKHVLAFPMSKYLRNSPPVEPDLVWQPKGGLRRWMKQRLVCENRKNCHLWYSWLQAKRAALPVSQDLVKEAYEEHAKVMGKPDMGIPLTVDTVLSNPHFQRVLNKLAWKLKDHFCPEDVLTLPRHSTCKVGGGLLPEITPSRSACYAYKRKEGGVTQCLIGEARFSSLGEKKYLQTTVLVSMKEIAIPFFDTITRTWRNRREIREVREDILADTWRSEMDLLRHRLFYDKIDDIRDVQIYFSEYIGGGPVEAHAIVEPFKIRMITKDSGCVQYFLKPVQQVLHTAMRKMDCFRLIGQKFCPTMLEDLKGINDIRRLYEDPMWLSIDYKAATDQLSWSYSLGIMEELFKFLPPNLRQIIIRSIGQREVEYPEDKATHLPYHPPVQQRSGQLMGHVLSFPILCLANLGLYLHVTDRVHCRSGIHSLKKRQELLDDPQTTDEVRRLLEADLTLEERLRSVLVNGDDMLYIADEETFDNHVTVGRQVGLEMSPGKAYVHSSYSNVNSTCSLLDLRKRNNRPVVVPYLNLGLYYGQRKVLDQSDHLKKKGQVNILSRTGLDSKEIDKILGAGFSKSFLNRSNLVGNIELLMQGSYNDKMMNDVLREYLMKHSSDIKVECQSVITGSKSIKSHVRNLFLPITSGGMGLEAPPGWRYRISKTDRILAGSLYHRMSSQTPIDTAFPTRAPLFSSFEDYRISGFEFDIDEPATLPQFAIESCRPMSKKRIHLRSIPIVVRDHFTTMEEEGDPPLLEDDDLLEVQFGDFPSLFSYRVGVDASLSL